MRVFTLLLLAAALAGRATPLAAQRLGGLEILAVPAGARAASLAGAVTAAGRELDATAALTISRTDAPDLYQHYLFAGATALRGIADVAAFARVLTFEAIPLLDENGTPLGEAAPQSIAVGVTAARRLLSALDAGASIKFVSVDLGAEPPGAASSARGTGFALDFGAVARPFADLPLSVGAAILDVGPALDLGGNADPLPTRLRLGIGIEPLALLRPEGEQPVRALLLLDREQGLARSADGAGLHFGAEVRLLEMLAVRGGLGTDGREAGRLRQGFGLGLGCRWCRGRSFRDRLGGSTRAERERGEKGEKKGTQHEVGGSVLGMTSR